MTVELWDLETGNIINTYSSEAEALAVVRRAIKTLGRTSVLSWALGSCNADGGDGVIYEGEGLADLALAALKR